MANNIKHCLICGTEYEYCPNCGSHINYPRWMYAFHEENCVNIFAVINDYRVGALTADQAKEKFNGLDISKKDTFVKFYKDYIDKILSEAKDETKPDKEPEKKVYNNSESKYNSSKKSFKK